MVLTYVIITHNRRRRLLETLQRLVENTPLSRDQWEVIVVDNASEDGTGAALRRNFPWVSLIMLPTNEGMPARNRALHAVRGTYLVFLDDDSYPVFGAIQLALDYFADHPRVGALVARCRLPNGTSEAPAFPTVTLGGATVLRRSVMEAVGGFATEFFRQAEEYDFSFRVWQAGFSIERFEDLIFFHDKDVLGARTSALTQRLDLQNNLILVERYLPRALRRVYRSDWLRRYGAMMTHAGHREQIRIALREARRWARTEAENGRSRMLDDATIERIFNLNQQADLVAAWKQQRAIRRVVIADVSKNLYATWRACQLAGLEVVAIADDNPAFAAQRYRGAPVRTIADAAGLAPDGVVLSNINPAQIDARLSSLRAFGHLPFLRLWEPQWIHHSTGEEARPAIAA